MKKKEVRRPSAARPAWWKFLAGRWPAPRASIKGPRVKVFGVEGSAGKLNGMARGSREVGMGNPRANHAQFACSESELLPHTGLSVLERKGERAGNHID